MPRPGLARRAAALVIVAALASACAALGPRDQGEKPVPGEDGPFPVLRDQVPPRPELADGEVRKRQAADLARARREVQQRADALRRRLEAE